MIGFMVTSSSRCFFVFLGRMSLISALMPPLSPLFIPSISSMTIAMRFGFFWNIEITLCSLML